MAMEEPGEHCTVVFALIVKNRLVSVCVGEGGIAVAGSVTIYNLCKDDSALFSRFLHGPSICQENVS
jgi:hypothetical protein